MTKKKVSVLLVGIFVLSTLAACANSSDQASVLGGQSDVGTVALDTGVSAASDVDTEELVLEGVGAESVEAATAENSPDHEDAEDYVWDDSVVISITLNGDSIAAYDGDVTVEGSTATITAAGTYSLSGSLVDGQIVVDTEDEDVVRLILSGVDIRNSTSAPIYVASAEKVVIILADGTDNYLSDAESYVFDDPDSDEPNAALFSKADLSISGNGSLTVDGNYNDGIASKDGLVIASGQIIVDAIDDGIRGRDYLIVEGGSFTVNALGDGLKSDNEDDAEKGYISIEGGTLVVTAGGDAIQAETDVLVSAGDLNLTSGGGSSSWVEEGASAKGIKGTVNVNIDGGNFVIDSADDAIHSNGSIVINTGTFQLASGDDGIHADSNVEINSGDIQISNSYEGIESAVITINDGNIHIVASDDGINVAGGNDGSGMMAGPGRGGGPGGGAPGAAGAGQDAFAVSGDYLYINGGTIVVEAAGDGLDSNGSIEMTGGVVIVNGPTENMNGALDYNGGFSISGGFLLAVGSSGMAQAPGEASSQYSVLLNLDSVQAAGTLVNIQTSDGEEILTFAPTKPFQSVVFSSPDLAAGTTYEVYLGGSSTGTVTDSLFQGGTYTPGTSYASFTIESIVTRLGGNQRW